MAENKNAQHKWDRIYQQRTEPCKPCWVLANHTHLLPTKQQDSDLISSLDLACGLGANSLLLAEKGLDSHAWDVSSVALDQLQSLAEQQSLSVTTLQRDIENHPPPPNHFDVIVVSQFLYRPIFPAIIAALKPGGLLFYQTYHQQKVTEHGPSNQKFLLAPNELLSLLADLELVFYREDARQGNLSLGLRDCSYYIGRKRN
jgi:SAM-dependent methyltransferase